MNELELLSKIDAVLKYINRIENPIDKIENPNFKTASEIQAGLKEQGLDLKGKELHEILGKLIRDNNAFSEERETVEYSHRVKAFVYYSTFEGKFLEIQGLYTAKFLADRDAENKSLEEHHRVVLQDEKNYNNQVTLNRLTQNLTDAGWAAAGGTAFLGLMELVKLLPIHFHFCHYCH